MGTDIFAIAGWTISSTKGPIANATESDELAQPLGFPHPTMTFIKNELLIASDTIKIRFTTKGAVSMVSSRSPDDIKVVYSQQAHWQEKKKQYRLELDYDWTYQSAYSGIIEGVTPSATTETIDYNRLVVRDQSEILWYDENILFEDEMGDNGSSIFSVKTRVMKFGIFVLARSFIRVDEVIFRSHETRFFIDLQSGHILQERRLREDSFENVFAKVGREFRNVALVADRLPQKSVITYRIQ